MLIANGNFPSDATTLSDFQMILVSCESNSMSHHNFASPIFLVYWLWHSTVAGTPSIGGISSLLLQMTGICFDHQLVHHCQQSW